MSTGRWPLTTNGNATIVGVVLIALMTIFGFLDKLPWSGKADKSELAAMEVRYQKEIAEMRTDVREIRNWVRRAPQYEERGR